MKKSELIQTDLRIPRETQNELEKYSRKLHICAGSFAKWLLFRGCLAHHNDKKEFWASLKPFTYVEKMPESKKVELEEMKKQHEEAKKKSSLPEGETSEKRVQIRGYNTLHTRISIVMKNQLWNIGRESGKRGKRQYMTELSNRIIKMEYEKFRNEWKEADLTEKAESEEGRKVSLHLSEQQYRDIEKIYEITGIKASDLIPLMICEYLKILNDGRIK